VSKRELERYKRNTDEWLQRRLAARKQNELLIPAIMKSRGWAKEYAGSRLLALEREKMGQQLAVENGENQGLRKFNRERKDRLYDLEIKRKTLERRKRKGAVPITIAEDFRSHGLIKLRIGLREDLPKAAMDGGINRQLM
jgi:hypothetical protein